MYTRRRFGKLMETPYVFSTVFLCHFLKLRWRSLARLGAALVVSNSGANMSDTRCRVIDTVLRFYSQGQTLACRKNEASDADLCATDSPTIWRSMAEQDAANCSSHC